MTQLWLILLETLPIYNSYLYASIFVGNAKEIWRFAIAIGIHMIKVIQIAEEGSYSAQLWSAKT